MSSDTDCSILLKLRKQLCEESRAMAKYALSNGLTVPADTLQALDAFALHGCADNAEPPAAIDLAPLIAAHQALCNIVKPALPGTLRLLGQEQESKSPWLIFGPLPIIRYMMIAGLLSLVLFISLALSHNVAEGAGNILKSNGLELLENLLFFLAAAGLGASFAALYKASSYIAQGNFDTTYNSSYWIRFCLGLISGLVLSVMVSDNVLTMPAVASGGAGALGAASGTASAPTLAGSSGNFFDPAFIRPLLAMLGGFSADLLYTILNRLVETLGSLFQGSTKNLIDIKQQEADARLATLKAQNQIDLAMKLVALQREVGTAANPADIQAKIDKLLNDVMPNSGNS